MERAAMYVHGADRQDRGQGGGNMETSTSIVAGCGNKEDTLVLAMPNRIDQHGVGLPRVAQLTAADVDDVRPSLKSLMDGASQLPLRSRSLLAVRINYRQQTLTLGRDAVHRAAGLPKDQAGDVGAVHRHAPAIDTVRKPRLQAAQVRPGEARMGTVHRAIQDRDFNPGIAESFRP
jgi:hypothetical protein